MSIIEWKNLVFPIPDKFRDLLNNWEKITELSFEEVFGFVSIFGNYDTLTTPPELMEIGAIGCDGSKHGIVYLDESDAQREWVHHCDGDGEYAEVSKEAEDLFSGLGDQALFKIEYNTDENINLDHIPEIRRICKLYEIPIQENQDTLEDPYTLQPIHQRSREGWLHVIAKYDNIGVFAENCYFHPQYTVPPEMGENEELFKIGSELVNKYPASAVLYLKAVRANWPADENYYADSIQLLNKAYLHMNKTVIANRLKILHPEIIL